MSISILFLCLLKGVKYGYILLRTSEVTGMINKVINVEGMSCDHCRNAVESALAKLNGVTSAEVDLDKNQVRVDYDENRVSVEQMKEAIEDQGYDVK